MLGNRQFYHETVRNIIIGFGTLFNDIHVVRKNNSGVITQSMKVPLAYGPTQKFLARLEQAPNLSQATQISLPRMSFVFDYVFTPCLCFGRFADMWGWRMAHMILR